MSTATNGWDAVLAMDTVAVNNILFYDYLKEGPGRRASVIRVIVDGDQPGDQYALELILGPPLVDLAKDTLEMTVLDGRLSFINSSGLRWMMPIERDSFLSGPLNLAEVTGKDVVGKVTLDLGKGAFLPTLTGVDPSSTLPVQIGAAIQAYYQGASVEIAIGSVVAGHLPAALTPTQFKLFKQQQPNGSDSCILFFIRTSGPGGEVAPLATYPLGADVSGSLILSDRTIFDGIIPSVGLPDGLSFESKEIGGIRAVTLKGTANCGEYGDPSPDSGAPGFSCDADWQFDSVYLPLDGLDISASNGGLTGNVQYSWTLRYMAFFLGGGFPHTLDLTGKVSLSLQPTVDPTTSVVTFKGEIPVDVSGGDDFLNLFSLGSYAMKDQVSQTLSFLRDLHIDINTYALQNIVFPGEQRLSLGTVAFDGNLTLQGHVQALLAVNPREVTLGPGATQAFSVDGSPEVLWQVHEGPGTITPAGVYTAPSTIGQNQIVVIEAVRKDNTSQVGYALVVVAQAPASTGLEITPGRLTMATSTAVYLEVTDLKGNPVDATVSLDSGAPGHLSAGRKKGQWLYTSPSNLSDATTVKVHASQGAATGTATLAVMNASSSVTVSASHNQLAAGQSATITAQGLDEVFYAADSGTISVDNDVVTYTAPSVTEATDQQVVAYGTSDDGSAGSGSVEIHVTPR